MSVTRKVALGALAVAATATGIWVLSDYRAWAAMTGGDWREWLAARTRRTPKEPDARDEPSDADIAAAGEPASHSDDSVAAQHGTP